MLHPPLTEITQHFMEYTGIKGTSEETFRAYHFRYDFHRHKNSLFCLSSLESIHHTDQAPFISTQAVS